MKKTNLFKKILSLALVICIFASFAVPAMGAEDEGIRFEQVDNSAVKGAAIVQEPVSPDMASANKDENETVRVSIVLDGDSTLDAGYDSADIASNSAAMKYRDNLKKNQKNVEKKIAKALGKNLKVRWNQTLAANIISADVRYGDIAAIEAVEGVSISETDLTLIKNNSTQLVAKADPMTLADRSVTWTTSGEAVAIVDENGVVTAVGAGECLITATAKADPNFSAHCAVTVISFEYDLNAVVWDEEGAVWMSHFNTANLPNYTKLTAESYNAPINALSYGPDGKLYASDLSTSGTLVSNLYTVDPETFALTSVGPSSIGYTDLAYAPHLGNVMLATYGPYVVVVDAATGDYLGAFNYSATELVGITYCGSDFHPGYNAYMDYYYLLDAKGNLYFDAFMPYNGNYAYFNGTAKGLILETGISCDTPYFQSLYFDGLHTYISNFNESKNSVTLYAVDTEVSGSIYKLGSFADGVWPVGGLINLPVVEVEAPAAAAALAEAEIAGAASTEAIEPIAATIGK